MKKILLLLIFLVPFFAQAKDENDYFEFTYFAKSTHLVDGDFNEDHNFLGLEYRNDHRGYGIAVFENSYYKQSVVIDYVKYWQPADFIETSARLGLVSGYDETPVAFVLSIAYTKYDMFRPKISWFGDAIIFSISFKF